MSARISHRRSTCRCSREALPISEMPDWVIAVLQRQFRCPCKVDIRERPKADQQRELLRTALIRRFMAHCTRLIIQHGRPGGQTACIAHEVTDLLRMLVGSHFTFIERPDRRQVIVQWRRGDTFQPVAMELLVYAA